LVNSQPWNLCLELLDEGYGISVIDDYQLGNQFNELGSSYNGKLKFYKSGTKPEGYLIKI